MSSSSAAVQFNTSALRKDAVRIGSYLSNYLTDVGIVDPDKGEVQHHSYTTATYSWLAAVLCIDDRSWTPLLIQALKAELDTLDEWWKSHLLLSQVPTFHWEFKNLALLHVYQQVKSQLPMALRLRLQVALTHWHDLDIDSANWTAMRLLNYTLRSQLFDLVGDGKRSRLERNILLLRQTTGGLFPDKAHSHSTQYHAYVLALIARSYQINGDETLVEPLLRGLRFALRLIDPAGDFNYFGRGQRQIFGYGALIYALRTGALLTDDSREAGQMYLASETVRDFVMSHADTDGIPPIVLNHERAGWYPYNLSGDYLVFYAIWTLLADELPVPELKDKETTRDITESTWIDEDAGIVVVQREAWMAVFARGEADDPAEPAGLVHLYPGQMTNLGYSQNPASATVGPVLNGKVLLNQCKATLTAQDEAVLLSSRTEVGSLYQFYNFANGLALTQDWKWNRTIAAEEYSPLLLFFTAEAPLNCDAQLLDRGTVLTAAGSKRQWSIDVYADDDGLVTHSAQLIAAQMSVNPGPLIRIPRGQRSISNFTYRVLRLAWVYMLRVYRRQWHKYGQTHKE